MIRDKSCLRTKHYGDPEEKTILSQGEVREVKELSTRLSFVLNTLFDLFPIIIINVLIRLFIFTKL